MYTEVGCCPLRGWRKGSAQRQLGGYIPAPVEGWGMALMKVSGPKGRNKAESVRWCCGLRADLGCSATRVEREGSVTQRSRRLPPFMRPCCYSHSPFSTWGECAKGWRRYPEHGLGGQPCGANGPRVWTKRLGESALSKEKQAGGEQGMGWWGTGEELGSWWGASGPLGVPMGAVGAGPPGGDSRAWAQQEARQSPCLQTLCPAFPDLPGAHGGSSSPTACGLVFFGPSNVFTLENLFTNVFKLGNFT